MLLCCEAARSTAFCNAWPSEPSTPEVGKKVAMVTVVALDELHPASTEASRQSTTAATAAPWAHDRHTNFKVSPLQHVLDASHDIGWASFSVTHRRGRAVAGRAVGVLAASARGRRRLGRRRRRTAGSSGTSRSA